MREKNEEKDGKREKNEEKNKEKDGKRGKIKIQFNAYEEIFVYWRLFFLILAKIPLIWEAMKSQRNYLMKIHEMERTKKVITLGRFPPSCSATFFNVNGDI